MTWPGVTAENARAALRSFIAAPSADTLMPRLALSVLTTGIPFSAAEVAGLALDVASEVQTIDAKPAESLLADCAKHLQRAGAAEQAADLLEARAILRYRSGV